MLLSFTMTLITKLNWSFIYIASFCTSFFSMNVYIFQISHCICGDNLIHNPLSIQNKSNCKYEIGSDLMFHRSLIGNIANSQKVSIVLRPTDEWNPQQEQNWSQRPRELRGQQQWAMSAATRLQTAMLAWSQLEKDVTQGEMCFLCSFLNTCTS